MASRRVFIITLGVLGLFLYGTLRYPAHRGSTNIPTASEGSRAKVNASLLHAQPICPTPPQTPNLYDPALFLRGPPTPHFRDNLRPEVQYITTWIPGGFTNDVMALANLIYVAIQSDRIPIIPEFSGYRGEWEAGFISFGEVFDIPQLSAALRIPILEWNQVKDYHGETRESDELGCWSVWAPYGGDPNPRGSFFTTESRASIDCSYTPIKEPVKLLDMNNPDDAHINLNKLAKLGDREMYDKIMQTHKPESFPPWHPNVLPPDFQLMCTDFLYWASVLEPFEWFTNFSPGWKIARHFKWSPKLQSLGQEYLRRLLAVPPTEAIPAFITVHVRRNDFNAWCNGVPQEECFASLDTYEVRVREIQAELEALPELVGQGPFKVIVTSDESDPEWWQQVRKRGWLTIDHSPTGEDTESKYGTWYSALVDIAIASMGKGFVGTGQSTMSLLSRRRVEEWNGGVTRMVKWGHAGADDH
ncbi:hypothetical protein FIBSPDRAFT_840084 [Athelia psychrophila]|uniref:GDP-fucose protein O-fucosyltransferase 2 n=1 Tax=Athelia psychrophila TaxID=1759441 RepID=A0A165XMB0_9AGAM|nr:hypothetical protein FIBSPDRAFT_840084 [Fibularhizoctonia sp. CBS 109695]